MNRTYWPILLCAIAFILWTDVHTDEETVILGLVLVFGAILGAVFHRRFLTSWLTLGAAVPAMELLVHFSLVHSLNHPATLPTIAGIALVSQVPALSGVALGTGMRKLVRGPKPAA